MKASELRPGQFFELEGERLLFVGTVEGKGLAVKCNHMTLPPYFWVGGILADTLVNPDCPQCWGEGEEERMRKALEQADEAFCRWQSRPSDAPTEQYTRSECDAKSASWQKLMRPLRNNAEAMELYCVGDNVLNTAKCFVEQITGFEDGCVLVNGVRFGYGPARNIFGLGVDLPAEQKQ